MISCPFGVWLPSPISTVLPPLEALGVGALLASVVAASRGTCLRQQGLPASGFEKGSEAQRALAEFHEEPAGLHVGLAALHSKLIGLHPYSDR